MRALHRLKRKYALSLLVLGHTPKRDGSRPLTLNDLGGSRHLANFADAVVGLGRSARDADVRYLKQLKVRSAETEYHGEHVATLRLEKPGNFLGFTLLGYGPESEHLKERTDDERAQRDAAILDLHAEGKSYREIAAQLAISKNTVQKVVQAAAVPVPPGVPVSPSLRDRDRDTLRNRGLSRPCPWKRDREGQQGDSRRRPRHRAARPRRTVGCRRALLAMQTTPPTPRDVRHRLNKMERYAERHAAGLGPRVVFVRSLFEVAVTADHADFLAAEIREALGTPAQPSPSHA